MERAQAECDQIKSDLGRVPLTFDLRKKAQSARQRAAALEKHGPDA